MRTLLTLTLTSTRTDPGSGTVKIVRRNIDQDQEYCILVDDEPLGSFQAADDAAALVVGTLKISELFKMIIKVKAA